MIYTLEQGLHKTSLDRLYQALRYGLGSLGIGALLLTLGNIWYALHYQPAMPAPSTHQPVQAPIQLSSTGGVDMGVHAAPDMQASSTSTSHAQPAEYYWNFSPVMPSPVVAAVPTGTNSAPSVGGMGAGPVATTSGDGSTGGSSVPTSGTIGDTGATATQPPATGTTTVTIPPVGVSVPVIDTTVTTGPVSVGL